MSGSAAPALAREILACPAPAGPTPAAPASDDRAPAGLPHRGGDVATALRPLAIDVGIPLAAYYLMRGAFGLSIWLSLALSSVSPAIRSVSGIVIARKPNLLAMLMLAVNVAGIVVSFLSGDPRAMIAKDSLVSSVIAIAILASVAMRRPLMSQGLKPYMTRGTAERSAAWDRLSVGSPPFQRLEMLFSAIWGLVLAADCIARLTGAYMLPVATMVWLSTVFTLGAVGLGIVAGGIAARPIEKMVETETETETAAAAS